MSTRRKFIVLSAAALSSAALPKHLLAERLGGPVFSNASIGAYEQGLMTPATFENLVGSEFRIFLEDYAVANLRLNSVTNKVFGPTPERLKTRQASPKLIVPRGADLSISAAATQPTFFQLHFGVSGGRSFPQDSYLLDHGTLGRFVAFLVPGDSGKCVATMCPQTASIHLSSRPVLGQPPTGRAVFSAD